MGEFQIRQPLDRFSARAQDVDSMGDSQIRDIRVAVEKRADQVLEQTDRYPSDSTWTPSPSPPMRDNPFRSRRLFCSRNQGSPSGPCSDQTKLEDTIRESVSECYRRHFCRLTRQFCNRFMAIHRNADRALRCTWCAEFLRRLEHDQENGTLRLRSDLTQALSGLAANSVEYAKFEKPAPIDKCARVASIRQARCRRSR
jgi:hypothetical protein